MEKKVKNDCIEYHKCPVCGFRTKIGKSYDKVGKKLIPHGKIRYCQPLRS